MKNSPAPASPVKAEEHPHLIERRRLQALLKEASDKSHSGQPVNMSKVEDARLRLYVLNRIIDTATEIQAMEPTLCYMTACDLIEELLLVGQEGKAK